MTLVARADALVSRIHALETMKSLAKEAQAFRTRAEQLQAAAQEVRRAKMLQVALGANGIVVASEQASSAPLATRARAMHSAFAAEQRAILSVQPPLEHSFLRPIRSLCARMNSASAETWLDTVNAILGAMPEDLLNVLEKIADLAPDVRRIRSLLAEGQRIAAKVPDPEVAAVAADLAVVRSLAAQKSERWERLSGGGIPEEVVRFLRRAAAREARLSEVTAGVLDWLTTRGLLSAFRVSPG